MAAWCETKQGTSLFFLPVHGRTPGTLLTQEDTQVIDSARRKTRKSSQRICTTMIHRAVHLRAVLAFLT